MNKQPQYFRDLTEQEFLRDERIARARETLAKTKCGVCIYRPRLCCTNLKSSRYAKPVDADSSCALYKTDEKKMQT